MSNTAIIITSDGENGRCIIAGSFEELAASLHQAMVNHAALKQIVLNVAANYERINAKVEALEQNKFLEEVKNIMNTHKPGKG